MEFTMTPLMSYRTKLLTEQQATAFCRMLRCNTRFAEVQLCHSGQARGEKQWLVRFAPSSSARREALLRGAQDARAQRAATQAFVFAANRREVWCYSVASGATYRMEADGSGCDCPDSQTRCRGLIACKHSLAWLASDERREMDATEARRKQENARFDAIFA